MNKAVPIVLLMVAVAGASFMAGQRTALPIGEPAKVEAANSRVYFSPHGGCTEAIVAELDKAKESVLIQAYSFTSDRIGKAAVEAHRRGVKVQAILDRSQRSEQYSELDFLARSGIPTFVDTQHSIAHNKVMVIDGQTVITGSFNFTKAAEEHNAENMLVINDQGLAEIYTRNWQRHAGHSEEYRAK